MEIKILVIFDVITVDTTDPAITCPADHYDDLMIQEIVHACSNCILAPTT